MMTTTVPITEATQLLSDPEPIEDRALADAEEEEIAELWASDPGNQGA